MLDDNELRTNSAALELRPLSTSELIDRGFQLYRRYFVPLFYFSAMLQVLPFALGLAFSFYWRQVGAQWHLVDPQYVSAQPMVLGQLLQFTVELILIFVATVVFLALSEGALTLYVARLYLGEMVSISQCVVSVLKGSRMLLYSTLIKYLVLALAFAPLLALTALGAIWAPQISVETALGLFIAAIIIAIPGLILVVRYILLIQIVILEKLGGWKALKRSGEITRYNAGLGFVHWGETRLSVILLVVVVVNLLVVCVSRLPEIAMGAGDVLRGNSSAEGISVPPLITMIMHLLNFLGSSLMTPLYVISGTLFYYDVRVRKEALDLELMANALQKSNGK